MKAEYEFINELMHQIINGVNIPKVQVERAVSPILGLFVEAILEKYFEGNKEYSGEYKLISPEFPLKKKNNQSTNIDYLLINEIKKVLVFLELKTDPGSLKASQLEIYKYYKSKVSKRSALFMQKDLDSIFDASSKKSKYETLVINFKSKIKSPEEINKIIIVYLVPKQAVNKISKTKQVDFVLSFGDLPENIEHKFAEFWKIIRDNLILLDTHFKEYKQRDNITDDPLKIIVPDVINFVSSMRNKKVPLSIQLGKTGKGTHPNYQVEFNDGTIETFFFNGKPHSAAKFKATNLEPKISWHRLLNKY